jgi:hypothetical protein
VKTKPDNAQSDLELDTIDPNLSQDPENAYYETCEDESRHLNLNTQQNTTQKMK